MSYIRDLISGWYVYGDPDGGLTIQYCGLVGLRGGVTRRGI